MGSGKSSLGKILAKEFNYDFAEQDTETLYLSGMQSISEIFEKKGESYFRELETKALENLIRKEKVVISTGGGVIVTAKNHELLKKSGNITIYLKTDFSELEKRLVGDQERPLFRDIEKAKALYEERLPVYLDLADFVINTNGKTTDDILEEIKDIL